MDVEPMYSNLKEEILSDNKLTLDMWNNLQKECETMIKSEKIKKISANGNDVDIYHIFGDYPFTIPHLLGMKLYTDFTNLCTLFNNAFRLKKFAGSTYESVASLKNRNKKYANMAKWLVECVQCFGKLYLGKKKYYRGVNQQFLFKKFVTMFRVPLSTTSNFTMASNFSGGGKGLIIEMRKYADGRDVSCFYCATVSAFDSEEEVLFFGGNSVLRISCIYQIYNNKWTGYRSYIEAIQCILSLINGTMIKRDISWYGKMKMVEMLQYIIDRADNKQIKSNLPPYVENLLNFHLENIPNKIMYDWSEIT
eukprot:320660_1